MEVDIEAIKRRMLIKYPLFGSVIANLNYISTDEISTASTDGKNIYYSPQFIGRLSKDEQTFILAHEVAHVAFDHIFRSEGKDPVLWNIATDAVINALLKKDKLKMVKGGVDIPEAVNYDAEQMYEKLLKEQEEKKKQQENKSQDLQNSNDTGQKGSGATTSSASGSGQQDNSDGEGENDQSQDQESNSKGENNTNKTSNITPPNNHDLWEKAVKEKNNNQQQKNSENTSKDFEDKNKKTEDNEKNTSDGKEKKKGFWSKLSKALKNKQQDSDNKSEKNQEQESKNNTQSDEIRKEIERLAKQGEKSVFKQNSAKRNEQLSKLKDELIQETLNVGNFTNSINREMQNIGSATALIDWRKMLKEAIKVDCDWSYVNATIEDGVVTPHLENFPKPETEILLDTSGSIDTLLLRNFIREAKNILKVSKVKVGCFDTEFYGFEEIRTEKDIESMRFVGGGGTDYNVAINAFSRRVENKIIFTDGLVEEMPNTPLDAIWIVFGNEEIHPVGGRVIYINPEQLMKLKYARVSRNSGIDR